MEHWARTSLQCFLGNFITLFRAVILQDTHKQMQDTHKQMRESIQESTK